VTEWSVPFSALSGCVYNARQEFFVASTTTRLMTFAEFEQLPDPRDGRLELRHGEVAKVPPPDYDNHFVIQQVLRDLLDQAASGQGRAYTEAPFRALPEGEYRVADVAYAPKHRWARPKPRGFEGAPDLVIEVLSPSNTLAEMIDKKILCLENGCLEFWLVDSEHRQVEVSTPDGHSITYKSGQEIPLLFGGGIPVNTIFSET